MLWSQAGRGCQGWGGHWPCRVRVEVPQVFGDGAARVEEARARLGFTRADQLPSIDVGGTVNRGTSLEQIIPDAGERTNTFVAASVSYEIDLFGRLRRSTEAARAELLAKLPSMAAAVAALKKRKTSGSTAVTVESAPASDDSPSPSTTTCVRKLRGAASSTIPA